jgi:hypothetical protein
MSPLNGKEKRILIFLPKRRGPKLSWQIFRHVSQCDPQKTQRFILHGTCSLLPGHPVGSVSHEKLDPDRVLGRPTIP